jgi:predicted 3-demethylubiquinone-9 3-methyltransferase (glyoxalase superfamily)
MSFRRRGRLPDLMTVDFELDGQAFVALTGGPDFTFNEAISFRLSCENHEEDRDRRTRASCCPGLGD